MSDQLGAQVCVLALSSSPKDKPASCLRFHVFLCCGARCHCSVSQCRAQRSWHGAQGQAWMGAMGGRGGQGPCLQADHQTKVKDWPFCPSDSGCYQLYLSLLASSPPQNVSHQKCWGVGKTDSCCHLREKAPQSVLNSIPTQHLY